MSTRAIRQALAELSALRGTTQVQAYEEVGAIEAAAREFDNMNTNGEIQPQYRTGEKAVALMTRIAEQMESSGGGT